jgi:hypothetical protein
MPVPAARPQHDAHRLDTAAPLYRIVSRCADLGASLTETYEITPWPDRRRSSDA